MGTETRVVWKVAVPAGPDDNHVQLPIGADMLSTNLSEDSDRIEVWSLCDPTAALVTRVIRVVFTGYPCHPNDLATDRFVGTVRRGSFVLHVFDGGDPT